MKESRIIRLILIMLIMILVFSACSNQSKPKNLGIYNITKISMSDSDKIEALKLARMFITNGKPEEKSGPGKCFLAETRGVFVSVARPEKPALTGFAIGRSIADAIDKASKDLKDKAKDENLSQYRLRIDVVEKSTGRKSQDLDKKWKLDVSLDGVIFDTNSAVALLPQELRDRGILNHKGEVSKKQLGKTLTHRGFPSSIIDSVISAKEVTYARISVLSFMENHDGKLVNLLRMNKAEGYEPTEQNLRKSIDAAGRYLANAVGKDGSFEYLYRPQTNSLPNDYNELRHAGTTFSMMQIYEVNKDPKVLEAVKRSLGWLQRHTRGPDENDRKKYDWKALNDKRFRYAKLGGSGLSLLAFGWYTKVTGDEQYIPLMQGYAGFIDYMMKQDGDVKMRYWNHAKDKDRSTKPVLYYPGEAFFGLATLYEIDKNIRWIDVGYKGIDFIVDTRDRFKPDRLLPHDHWMAYAIANIYRVKPKASHVKHAWRLFGAMDKEFHHDHRYPDYVGGHFKTPVSVRTGCRLEATSAFYRLAEQLGDKKRMDQFFNVLQKGSSFLMRTQYDDVNTMFFVDPKKPQGAMMRTFWEPSTQIDYTQHSVSALIETYNITRERAEKANYAQSEQ